MGERNTEQIIDNWIADQILALESEDFHLYLFNAGGGWTRFFFKNPEGRSFKVYAIFDLKEERVLVNTIDGWYDEYELIYKLRKVTDLEIYEMIDGEEVEDEMWDMFTHSEDIKTIINKKLGI